MAAPKLVPNSFHIALEVDAVLQAQLPELTRIAGQNTHAVAVALLLRGFMTLREDHYPRESWDYLFRQVMDLAETNSVPLPA